MGGQAFALSKPPLHTPRMPPEIYAQVRAQTHSILRKYYSHVDSAIEAPAKESYGDVDTYVYGPLDTAFESSETGSIVVAQNLAKVLGATKFMRQTRDPIINLAIPWPERGDEEEEEKKEGKYVQVDVNVCSTLTSFTWSLFHSAHGDLWNILGSTIRPFGLTVNNRGMHLRIPEIELHDRKKSMIFLTNEPNQILPFLGLDEERWWRPFGNWEEMFEYAAGCRMFFVKENLDDKGAPGEATSEGEAKGNGDVEGQIGGEEGKKKLKSNDRRRMAKRPIFKAWMDEFIPKCRERGTFEGTTVTRKQIQEEAIQTFNIKEECQTRLREWNLEKQKGDLWREILLDCVPLEGVDPVLRAAAIRTLKSTIMDGLEFDGVVPQASWKDDEGLYDQGEVRRFVQENWERAGQIGLARQEARSLERIKANTGKKAKENEVLAEVEDRKRKEAPV